MHSFRFSAQRIRGAQAVVLGSCLLAGFGGCGDSSLDVTITLGDAGSGPGTLRFAVSPDRGTSPLIATCTANPDGAPLPAGSLCWTFDGLPPDCGPADTHAVRSFAFNEIGVHTITLVILADDGTEIEGISTQTGGPTGGVIVLEQEQQTPTSEAPTVEIGVGATSGPAPFTATFVAIASDADGVIVGYAWDFGDGTRIGPINLEAGQIIPLESHTYDRNGTFEATLVVADNDGQVGVASVQICVGDCCQSDSECDDGTFCNGSESCINGSCLPGFSPCTGRLCDEASDRCVNCLNDSDCDDGQFCNGAETCANGACRIASDPCPGQQCDEATDSCEDCLSDSDCNDGLFCNGTESCVNGSCQSGNGPCTGGFCDEAGDSCVSCLDNQDCDDGVYCNGPELCVSGSCRAAADPCPGQQCDESANACTACLIDADCNDGSFCNGSEVCNSGACQAGSNPCLAGPCDEAANACVQCLSNSDCNNGLFCDGTELCVGGSCQAGPNPCPGQQCDETGNTCVECLTDGECDDGSFCNGSETCAAGSCQAGSQACPGQQCDEASGTCVECLSNGDCDDDSYCNGTETCVDGACTAGSDPCPGATCLETSDECVNCVNDGDCDDGLFCNGTESCVSGSCQAGTQACPGQQCDDVNDICTDCTNNSDCDDGLFCNGAEVCSNGSCQSASGPCSAGYCDESADSCVGCLQDSHCDDGVFCNGAETCVNGSCQTGGNPCPSQQCDETLGACVDCLNNGDCDDGTFCNGAESCENGSCQAAASAPCSGGLCDESVDACVNCIADADCDDSVFCNGVETCSNGSCQSGASSCPGQQCDEAFSGCVDCLNNSDCDDGQFCNGPELCAGGSCQSGTAPCTGRQCDESVDSCVDCLDNTHCDDGLFCNGDETCANGTCQAGNDPCPGQGCDDSSDICLDSVCVTGTPSWQNFSVASYGGAFTAQFDVIPGASPIDAVVALSSGAGSAFSDFAAIVRFNNSGSLDARNGGAYGADATVNYVPGTNYHFRLEVNVPAHTYSVYVTEGDSGAETTLAANYAFRVEQGGVTSLDNWAVWAGSGTANVCDMAVSTSGPLSANAGPDKTVITGSSATLEGFASGGSGIYTFSWSPATGLSDANVARPNASPSVSTTYTLTVSDSDGASALDSVNITVQSAPLRADAGSDKAIPPGSSVALDGSASGGNPPYSFAWSPTTGLDDPNAAQPVASPSQTTTYTLTVTDNDGATEADTVTVSEISGNIYYVDRNHPSASDSNPGTEALPWSTIGQGAATAQAGDTVMVKAGVYNETVRPANSGTPGALITFMAYPGHECQGGYTKTDCQVILDGGNSRGTAVNVVPRNYIRVEGFEMRNFTGDVVFAQGPGNNVVVEGVQIVNNYLHDCGGWGIMARGSTKDLLVENNEIRDVYRGAQASNPGGGPRPDGFILRANHIWRTYCDGFRGGGNNFIFEYNRIHSAHATGCHRDALDMSNMHNLIIRYNTIYDYTQLVYLHEQDGPSSNIQVYGNVIYTNEYPGSSTGKAPGIFFSTFNSVSLTNVSIHSNTFGWVGYNSIRIFGSGVHGVVLRNNIFIDGGVGSGIENPDEVSSDYNLFYTTPGSDRQAIPWINEGPHSIIGQDPLFVDYRRHGAWDFRLQPNSPAIDAGDPNLGSVYTLPSDFSDVTGRARPVDVQGVGRDGNGAFDMGAYEYVP